MTHHDQMLLLAAPKATAAGPARPPEAGAAPTAPATQGKATGPPPKTAPKLGTFGQRWRDRMSRETVEADMAFGCCANRCVDKPSTDQVADERTEQSKHGSDVRRLALRTFLEDNKESSSGIGYNLHTEDGTVSELCPTAFGVLRGYGKGYLSVPRKMPELENNTMMRASCAVGPFSTVSTS